MTDLLCKVWNGRRQLLLQLRRLGKDRTVVQHLQTVLWRQCYNAGKFWLWGAPVPSPFYRWGPNLVCYSRPTVYTYLPNFVSIGLLCCPLLAKNPNFAVFVTSAFSGVNWQQSEKVEHGCTTTNLSLPNGIKIVFVLQHVHGKIVHTNSDVQKHDGQTDRQKTQRFWLPRWWVKSEPHQTWHGDRGPWARSCSSKTFGGLMHSFATRGRWKFGDNQTSST